MSVYVRIIGSGVLCFCRNIGSIDLFCYLHNKGKYLYFRLIFSVWPKVTADAPQIGIAAAASPIFEELAPISLYFSRRCHCRMP